MRQIGGEGVVSKRRGSVYRCRESRDWLKTKVFHVGRFVIIGFQELGGGRLEALHVAEERDGVLCPAGQVRFGFAGRGLWSMLDECRAGPPTKGIVPIEPFVAAEIKFFGRYKGGAIRDGVLLATERESATPAPGPATATPLSMPSITTRWLGLLKNRIRIQPAAVVATTHVRAEPA